MSNAFAPIVRARPNPIFGRPVHQGSPPIDYSPILLLKPFGFRIAPDTLSSDENLVGQRGITPAFGYSAPHPSAGGTLTLLIHALPSAHYGLLRPCAPLRYSRPRGWSRLRLVPSRRRRDEAQVLTFRTKAWSSFAPPTCRMPLGQYQGIPRADPGGRVTPRF